jgi:hypothetical protein
MTVTEITPGGNAVSRLLDVATGALLKILPFVHRRLEIQVDDEHRVIIEGPFVRLSRTPLLGLEVSLEWEHGPRLLVYVRGLVTNVRAIGKKAARIKINGDERATTITEAGSTSE